MLTAHASFQTDLMSLLTGLAAMGRHVSPHLRGFDRPLMLSHAIRMEQMASLLSGSSCGFNAPVKLRLTSELMSRTMVTMKQLDASAIAGIAGLSHSMESAALACARFRGACSSVRKLSDDSAKLFEWANSCIQSIRRLHLMTRPDYQDASVAVITFKGQGPVLQALLANFVSSVFRLKRRLNKYCT